MTRQTFRVPDIGEGTAEVELVKWHVKPGDWIEEDQVLAELMTEKATVEIPSPMSARVVELHGAVGSMLPVGSPLVEFEVGAADGASEAAPAAVSSTPATHAETPRAAESSTAPTAAVASSPPPSVKGSPTQDKASDASVRKASNGPDNTLAVATRTSGERPVASPAVRAKADALGVSLQYVAGSGPGGRITHEDLDAYVANKERVPGLSTGPSKASPNTTITDVQVIGLRRKIAQQMQESKKRIPHFSYIEEVDVTDLEEFRQYLNDTKADAQVKLTLLPFVIRAVVKTLPQFPQINARFDDEAGIVHRYGGVHVGIATQTPNGLIVPVINHAETMDLWDLAREISRLAAATRAGTAKREELSGSSITITSLGPLGGIAHTPVINHPEVAIVGPNKIFEKVVVRGGEFVARKVMNISSSFDHRVVDGWDAAEFIQKVRTLLERPILMFMER